MPSRKIRSHFICIVSSSDSERLFTEKTHDPRDRRDPAEFFRDGYQTCEKELGSRVCTLINDHVVTREMADDYGEHGTDEKKSGADQHVLRNDMSRVVFFQFAIDAFEAQENKNNRGNQAEHKAREADCRSCSVHFYAFFGGSDGGFSHEFKQHFVPHT